MTQRVEVQAFRISPELAIAMLPGEFFVVTGRSIASRSPFQHTFVSAYEHRRLPPPPSSSGAQLHLPEPEAAAAVDAAGELLTCPLREHQPESH
jgi:hypothetical protein